MLTRRAFLRTGTAAGATLASFAPEGLTRIAHAAAAVNGVAPDAVAKDEDFWLEVQQAFTVDRSIINLNNGGVCPSPRVVQEAMQAAPRLSRTRRRSTPCGRCSSRSIEAVRQRLAPHVRLRPRGDRDHAQRLRGAADRQLGIDLEAGDEVVTTQPGLPADARHLGPARAPRRHRAAARSRSPCRRRGPSDIVEQLRARDHAAHARAPHLPHDQPDRADPAGARDRADGAASAASPVIVDGAHAFAHFPFTLARPRAATTTARSLHKWLLAPHGTGLLYVRRDRIASLWPLMAAPAS